MKRWTCALAMEIRLVRRIVFSEDNKSSSMNPCAIYFLPKLAYATMNEFELSAASFLKLDAVLDCLRSRRSPWSDGSMKESLRISKRLWSRELAAIIGLVVVVPRWPILCESSASLKRDLPASSKLRPLNELPTSSHYCRASL